MYRSSRSQIILRYRKLLLVSQQRLFLNHFRIPQCKCSAVNTVTIFTGSKQWSRQFTTKITTSISSFGISSTQSQRISPLPVLQYCGTARLAETAPKQQQQQQQQQQRRWIGATDTNDRNNKNNATKNKSFIPKDNDDDDDIDVADSQYEPSMKIRKDPIITTTTSTTTTPITSMKLPKLTAAMKQELASIEKRFKRLELEPHGRHRGISIAFQMMKEEKLEKRVTMGLANQYLNNWIYKQYSLALGYNTITDVPSEILADTLIRPGTTIRFWKYKNPKTILKEMYRYPQRPTNMQQKYVEKDQKVLDGTDGNNNNNDTTGAENDKTTKRPLTPEEEERERNMWDPRIFAPKLYGYKARRQAKKHKKWMHDERQKQQQVGKSVVVK